MSTSPKRMQVELSRIERVAQCQQRVLFEDDTVADLVEALENGEELPPVVLFSDGQHWWCADGHYRLAASEAAGRSHIYADVHSGTLRDAILYSCGANSSHGKKRTSADITKAIKTLLSDDQWGRWPESRIANACKVTRARVQRIKAEMLEEANGDVGEGAGEGKPPPILFTIEDDRQRTQLASFAAFLTKAREIAEAERWPKAERQCQRLLDGASEALLAEV